MQINIKTNFKDIFDNFLKQKEFCEVLTHTFHDLAMRKVGPYNEKLEEK